MYRKDPSNNKLLPGSGDKPQLQATSKFHTVINTLPETSPVPLQLIKLGLLSEHLCTVDSAYEINVATDEATSGAEARLPRETLRSVRWFLFKIKDELPAGRKKRIGNLIDETGMNRPPEQSNMTADIKTVARDSFDQQINLFYETLSARDRNAQTDNNGSPDETRSTKLNAPSSARTKDTSSSVKNKKSTASAGGPDDRLSSDIKIGEDISTSSGATTDVKTDSSDKTNTDDVDQNPSHQRESSANTFESGKEITTKGGERITGKNPFADTDLLKETGLHQGGG